jgi:hypothetical protein
VGGFAACGYCLIVHPCASGTNCTKELGRMYNTPTVMGEWGKSFILPAFVTAKTWEHDITFKILQNIPIREPFFMIDIVMDFTIIPCHPRDEKIIKGRK